MMAVMVLGMPQVHGCHASAGSRMLWDGMASERRSARPLKIRISAMGDQPDPNGWRRLPGYKVYPHVHVQPGWPVEKSEVLEVPTAVRNTGRGLLGGG
jgi:hypothetical protein